MDSQKSLKERCRVVSGHDGDRFVGVKADTDDAAIYFPLGYRLPENDADLRLDIQNLFAVLSAFMKEDRVLEAQTFDSLQAVKFPIHAYLKVITSFLRTGRYYIESDPKYKTAAKGPVSWSRTVREQRALVQRNGSLIFTNMTVRSVTPNTDKQITQIHRFCVYEAFDKLGWLYVPFQPDPPGPHPTVQESLHTLTKKLAASHRDSEQELFGAMKKMLQYMDEKNPDRRYFFGTDYFEHVWERMVDKAFGIPGKAPYFPRTRWLLNYGADRVKTPLYPDSIMIYRDKYYVLDAKYYRYGQTGDASCLPNGSDINKQITYGEYIKRIHQIPNNRLFNAFVMPYNMVDNPFGLRAPMGNIGEAVGDWRANWENYERIQGIVIDTRFLMYHYIGMPETYKGELAASIETVLARAAVPSPV